MAKLGVYINVALAVFNMLPFFPLDGHHIARENLSGEPRDKFIQFQPYGPFFIVGLLVLDHMLMNAGYPGPISWPMDQLAGLLFHYVSGFSA
jgi:Zn-dependent protease